MASAAVSTGRHPSYSEPIALEHSISIKLYYAYHEDILTVLYSFPQENVSNFLFESTRIDALNRFSKVDGNLSDTEFYKLLYFIVNIYRFVETDCDITTIIGDGSGYDRTNNFEDFVFNDIQASLSIAVLICRYLFTIYNTILPVRVVKASGKGKKGGMPPNTPPKSNSKRRKEARSPSPPATAC